MFTGSPLGFTNRPPRKFWRESNRPFAGIGRPMGRIDRTGWSVPRPAPARSIVASPQFIERTRAGAARDLEANSAAGVAKLARPATGCARPSPDAPSCRSWPRAERALFSLSNALEQFANYRTRKSIEALLKPAPKHALRRENGTWVFPIREIRGQSSSNFSVRRSLLTARYKFLRDRCRCRCSFRRALP
jgi:hypothetical protein